jgi:ubiquinone/menaquinone biosynthesis C-methylase UbiE
MKERNIEIFNKDSRNNEGYLYITSEQLSARMSRERVSAAIHQLANLRDKTVIDVGSGDGSFSLDLLSLQPKSIVGIDAAADSVALANRRAVNYPNVHFEVADIYTIEPPEIRYDIAIVRGFLHHLDDVEKAINRICLLADEIIVLEPNGYNPILKIIEKTSRYHIEHEEKSYAPYKLDLWFKKNGGKITKALYIGLVPTFCPNWLAKTAKFFEPLVERIPVLRQLGCAQYLQKISMR